MNTLGDADLRIALHVEWSERAHDQPLSRVWMGAWQKRLHLSADPPRQVLFASQDHRPPQRASVLRCSRAKVHGLGANASSPSSRHSKARHSTEQKSSCVCSVSSAAVRRAATARTSPVRSHWTRPERTPNLSARHSGTCRSQSAVVHAGSLSRSRVRRRLQGQEEHTTGVPRRLEDARSVQVD